MRIITLFLLLAAGLSLADDSLNSLKQEVEALKRIRMDKANQLEKAEAARWQSRYAQNQATTEYQNETRILEGNYSKASDNISRMAAEAGALRNLATEQKDKIEAANSDLDNFRLLVKQAVEKSIDETALDFPSKIEERLLNFANNPPNIETFFQDRLDRLALTQNQEFTAKDAYHLRLGTVFLAEAGPGESDNVSVVLRTGALQGKVFEWRSALSKELSADIKQTVFLAQQKADSAWVPIDILHTKSIMGTGIGAGEQTLWQRFAEWFISGGLVMYPLTLVALAALLIGLERSFVLWRWGHISKTFTNKLHALVKNNQTDDAKKLCQKQKTCLGQILEIILDQKSPQESLLSIQASLEKRMGFLAALGAVAPLLGLLGTVVAMITLFNVITQAGTNDARILAGGISEALVTTEAGLIVAIPIMLLHSKLSETLDFITTELRTQGLALMNILPKT